MAQRSPEEIEAAKRRSPAEVARIGYEAWNSGDLETFLEYLHPELEWVSSGVFPGLRPSYSGHAGFREFWAAFMEPWETLKIEIEEMSELDHESVLIRARFHARGREGIEVDRRITNHLTMREGVLYRFKGYMEWEEALAELGIEDRGERRDPQA